MSIRAYPWVAFFFVDEQVDHNNPRVSWNNEHTWYRDGHRIGTILNLYVSIGADLYKKLRLSRLDFHQEDQTTHEYSQAIH